jgi:ABC-type branched-subunit amino acid transport system ATPase component
MSTVDGAGQSAVPPPGADGDAILSTTGITKVFGGLVAVEDVTLVFPRGRIVSIIGRKGAG